MFKFINVLLIGGAIGTVARYLLSVISHRFLGYHFPYGTLIVNLIGCLIIGFISALPEEKIYLNQQAKIFLMTGFCGAFTTLSTLIFETNELISNAQFFKAFLNIFISVLAGFLFLRVGIFIAQKI